MYLRRIELHDEDDELLVLDVYFDWYTDGFDIIQVEDVDGDDFTNHKWVRDRVQDVVLSMMKEEERKYND